MKCEEGSGALRTYRRQWDDERKVFYERPHHDFASHPADAFRYLAISLQDPVSKPLYLPKRRIRGIV